MWFLMLPRLPGRAERWGPRMGGSEPEPTGQPSRPPDGEWRAAGPEGRELRNAWLLLQGGFFWDRRRPGHLERTNANVTSGSGAQPCAGPLRTSQVLTPRSSATSCKQPRAVPLQMTPER